MTENTPKQTTQKSTERGFFSKMLSRIDDSMKKKADQKAKESECCDPNKKGGGKCC